MKMIRLAEVKAKELSQVLQSSLKAHDVERVQARIRRHTQTPPASQLQGRAVTILTSDAAAGELGLKPLSLNPILLTSNAATTGKSGLQHSTLNPATLTSNAAAARELPSAQVCISSLLAHLCQGASCFS